MKVGLLYSGGLESTILLSYYQMENIEVELLYLKVGFLWEDAELLNIKKNLDESLVLHIVDLGKQFNTKQLGYVDKVKKNIIPNRNLLMLSIASTYFYNIGIINIAIGMQGGIEYPDTDMNYLNTLEKLIAKGLQEPKFKIQMPFYGLTKKEILSRFGSKIDLDTVFSCTNPINNKMCMKCYKCKKLNNLKSKRKK